MRYDPIPLMQLVYSKEYPKYLYLYFIHNYAGGYKVCNSLDCNNQFIKFYFANLEILKREFHCMFLVARIEQSSLQH